ncbi:unnamed protein product [Meganyctiphanes norvegica]|uniref:Uncharacterized protein n=1 Tax=Meganyctiphanes norvegica TaxID=48144 RepID=A0AAV2RJB2_MEGNR
MRFIIPGFGLTHMRPGIGERDGKRHRPQYQGAHECVMRPIEILIINQTWYMRHQPNLVYASTSMQGLTHVAKIFHCINLTLSHYFWAQWLEAGRYTARVFCDKFYLRKYCI